ncbi:MAG: hypothetical protein O7G88_14935 [bacterium]|nr:hypothetical protein [bacterium]
MITTTLYNLIAVLQGGMEADNDAWVVAAVHHLIASGRIKIQRDQRSRMQDIDIPPVTLTPTERRAIAPSQGDLVDVRLKNHNDILESVNSDEKATAGLAASPSGNRH